MALTLAQAQSDLAAGNFTGASLLKFLESVSGKVEGAAAGSTYLLYSGVMPDGTTHASELVTAMANEGALHLGQSDIGKLRKASWRCFSLCSRPVARGGYYGCEQIPFPSAL